MATKQKSFFAKFSRLLFLLFPLALLLVLYFFNISSSQILVHFILLLDYFSIIDAFHNSYVLSYHQQLIRNLSDKNEQSIPVLYQENITKELFYNVSRGYTFPVVIRGSNSSFPAINTWNNINWWIDNYGNDTVLCKDIRDGIAVASCTIRESLIPKYNVTTKKLKKYYVVGEAKLFKHYPELEEMISSPIIKSIVPGRHVFTQLFMGYGGMGSDVHSALGCNLFHQVVGKKKWWVFPPSQTPYLIPSINKNGLSIYTMTRLGSGKQDTEPSPWLSKLERYTAILEPGDVLFDAPWFWHGVENLGNENELVIGVASRSMTPLFSSSFQNNWLLTIIGIVSIARDFGLNKFLSSPDSFQQSLETSRNIQANRVKTKQATQQQQGQQGQE